MLSKNPNDPFLGIEELNDVAINVMSDLCGEAQKPKVVSLMLKSLCGTPNLKTAVFAYFIIFAGSYSLCP